MLFILIYVALVIVRPQEYPAFSDVELPLLSVALGAAALSWLIAGRKDFSLPQYPLLFAFFVVTMISIAVNGWVGGAVAQATQFAPTIIAFVLLANGLTTQPRLIATMQVLILCSLVLALHGAFQVENGIGWTGMPLVQEDGRIQYIGIFADPNDLGLLFVTVLPMTLYLSMRGGLLGLARLFWLAAAGLLLYGVYLTNSRGSMLAVAVMGGVWLWLRRGLIVALVLGGSGLAVLQMLPSRLQELDAGEESAAGRVEAWYEGLQMFQGQPLFGVGTGNFVEHYFLTAHNSFVLVLAETGFIGYIIWLAFVGYCFRMMYTLCRYAPTLTEPSAIAQWRAERRIGMTLFIALCGFFAAAFFLSRSYVIVLYILAAMVVGHYALVSRRHPELPRFRIAGDIGRWLFIAIGSIAALYVVVKVLL